MSRRWFLPSTPDLLGMLRHQHAITSEGIEAFAAWAHGDQPSADLVRSLEHEADDAKRELWRALRTAFMTPLDAEDLFALSAGLDEVLNGAKDVVRAAEVMALAPDGHLGDMADCLVAGVRHLGEAFARLTSKDGDATEAADAATKQQRNLERAYRRAMSSLFGLEDVREVVSRRELYGRLTAVGEQLRGVAERVWYAVVKEA